MKKSIAALVLLLRFLRSVVISGWNTMLYILSSKRQPAGFLRFRFAPMSPAGASLLGCMITLTPGTTTVHIDMERREMLLHLLDFSDPEAAIDDIRREFEPYCVTLFGERA